MLSSKTAESSNGDKFFVPTRRLTAIWESVLNYHRTVSEPFDSAWVERRLKERASARKAKRIARLSPSVKLIDASKFPVAINDLTRTLIYKLEREGHRIAGLPDKGLEICNVLRQVGHTYNLICFINAEETRFEGHGYRSAYSFVSLPLVRTMIDGLYNCTAMLNDPARARQYVISGFFRLRETLEANEATYGARPDWVDALMFQRRSYEAGLRITGVTNAELNDKKNQWPLLGTYLREKPDTPHKQMLRKLTLGFWREYSSISHASFDGLTGIFPFVVGYDLPARHHDQLDEATERTLAMHVFRAGGLLMCLLTEIQHFCRFDGANIDQRLADTWASMLEIYEIRELYDLRYRSLIEQMRR